MDNVTAKNETELGAELRESRERLDALAGELRAVDVKLEELQVERQQFELVQEACSALEKLAERDAAELFWRELVSVDAAQEHVNAVRTRVDVFQSRVAEIEGDRAALLQSIEREEWTEEVLEDDLDELKRLEEEKKLEWLVERDVDESPARTVVMPWASRREEDERLRRALALRC